MTREEKNQDSGARPAGEAKTNKPYFYFDITDESHRKLLDEEQVEASQYPLENLKKVTEIDY